MCLCACGRVSLCMCVCTCAYISPWNCNRFIQSVFCTDGERTRTPPFLYHKSGNGIYKNRHIPHILTLNWKHKLKSADRGTRLSSKIFFSFSNTESRRIGDRIGKANKKTTEERFPFRRNDNSSFFRDGNSSSFSRPAISHACLEWFTMTGDESKAC